MIDGSMAYVVSSVAQFAYHIYDIYGKCLAIMKGIVLSVDNLMLVDVIV